MKQILYTLIYLLLGSCGFSQECEECVCEEPVDVWYRISTNEAHRYGELMLCIQTEHDCERLRTFGIAEKNC